MKYCASLKHAKLYKQNKPKLNCDEEKLKSKSISISISISKSHHNSLPAEPEVGDDLPSALQHDPIDDLDTPIEIDCNYDKDKLCQIFSDEN